MKKKIIMTFSLILIAFSLSGCNIKFIEKAPEKESTEEDLSGLGTVDIDPEDEDHLQLTTREELEEEETSQETFSKDDVSSTETSESTEAPRVLGENQKEVNGIIFDTVLKEVYATEKIALFSSADLSGNAAETIDKDTVLTLTGISEDKTIAMIKNATGSILFVEYRYLKEKPKETTTNTTSTSSEVVDNADGEKPSSTKTSSNTSEPEEIVDIEDPSTPTPSTTKPSTSEVQPQNPQPAQTTPSATPTQQPEQTQPTQEPPKVQGGIAYPSNPKSTSINLGVTFADESFTATVVNKTTMNSGPGKVLNSTGYTVIETFEAGTTVNCTGIGNNGYIRVELANGTVGFILNTDLKR